MRARNLKPSLFKNELLAVADPLHTIVFAGLWCMADREGRLEDRPAKIHLEINPGRSFDATQSSLAWLESNGFIQRYEVGKAKYLQVVAFSKHQHPHHREPPSILPAPEASPRKARGKPRANPGPARLIPPSGFPLPDSCNGATREDAVGTDDDSSLPPGLDPAAWKRWHTYRREIRKPLKPVSIPAAQRELAAFGADQSAVVEQSIAHGWQGLFELKRSNGKAPPGPPPKRPPPTEAEVEEARRKAAEQNRQQLAKIGATTLAAMPR